MELKELRQCQNIWAMGGKQTAPDQDKLGSFTLENVVDKGP